MYSMRKLKFDKSYEFIKTLKKIDESITDYLLTIIEHSAIIVSGTLAYYDANGFIVRGDEETSIALTNDRMSNYSIYIIADETGIEALEEIDAFEPEDESIETTTDTTNEEKKEVVDVAHDNDGIVGLIKRQVTYTFDLTKVELGLPYRITFLEDTVIFDVAYRKGSNIYALLLRAFPGRLIFVQTRMMGSGDDYDDLCMEKILMIFELTPNMKFKLERCDVTNQKEESL